MVSFVDALYSRFADPTYSECSESCELFIIGSLSPGKSGKKDTSTQSLSCHPVLVITECPGSQDFPSVHNVHDSCLSLPDLNSRIEESISSSRFLLIMLC